VAKINQSFFGASKNLLTFASQWQFLSIIIIIILTSTGRPMMFMRYFAKRIEGLTAG
jgi:hypothetical protein